jgi:GT2 family glycosyltransferase
VFSGNGLNSEVGCRPDPFTVTASVVTFNSNKKQLEELLDSFSRSSQSIAVTVVDNSATEELRSVVTGKGHAYLHSERNVGFGSGHNLVMGKCLTRSKYHVVVNPDIHFGEEVIRELYNFMENHPDVGLVMPSIRYPDGSPQGLCKLLPTPADLIVRRFLGRIGKTLFRKLGDRYELKSSNLTVPCEVPCLSGCFMFIRSTELQRIGLFDERFFMYLEDVDLCRRIGQSSKCVYYPGAFVTHEYAKGSYNDFGLLRHHAQSALRYFSKWGWFHDVERKRLNERAGLRVENRSR